MFGLETEYAILFEPAAGERQAPDGPSIYDAISASVLSRVRALPARHRKHGHFLENGAFLHYEGRAESEPQGLLELSTPECRTARDVALYSKAGEKLLADALPDAEKTLAAAGYPGTIVLGKNARDAFDNTYGSHENYLVRDPIPRARALLLLAAFLVLRLPLQLYDVLRRAGELLYVILTFGLYLCGLAVMLVLRLFRRRDERSIPQRIDRFLEEVDDVLRPPVRRVGMAFHLLFRPAARLLSAFMRLFLFEDIRRFLPTFLATRQIFTGAGHFSRDPDEPIFSVTEKAASITCVTRLYWDDARHRPMIDLKNFLFDARAVVAPEKRLQLVLSDSNMSDVADFLKFGTTSLVLRAIEEGAIPAGLCLADPVDGLHRVAGDPELRTKLALADGRELTALQIQWEYLTLCEGLFRRSGTVSISDREVLREWRQTLTDLEADPALASDRLDWPLKLFLIGQSLEDVDAPDAPGGAEDPLAALEVLDPWREIVLQAELSGVDLKGDGRDMDRLRALLPRDVFERLQRGLAFRRLDPSRLERQADRIYRAKKADLKYHDITPGRGYYARARATELARPLHDDERVAWAANNPPAGTRAALRGAFVKSHHRDPGGRVNWTGGRARKARVRFGSPFDTDA
ncbi:MAG: proteasome accessory factor PafA2 family protein [Acidobacteriota bacterium]